MLCNPFGPPPFPPTPSSDYDHFPIKPSLPSPFYPYRYFRNAHLVCVCRALRFLLLTGIYLMVQFPFAVFCLGLWSSPPFTFRLNRTHTRRRLFLFIALQRIAHQRFFLATSRFSPYAEGLLVPPSHVGVRHLLRYTPTVQHSCSSNYRAAFAS